MTDANKPSTEHNAKPLTAKPLTEEEFNRLLEEAPPLTKHLLKEAMQDTEVIGEVRPASEESKEEAASAEGAQRMELEGPSNASPLDKDAQVARAKLDMLFVLDHFQQKPNSPCIIEGISLDYLHAIRQLLKPPLGALTPQQWSLCRFLYINLSQIDPTTGRPREFWLHDLPGFGIAVPPRRHS